MRALALTGPRAQPKHLLPFQTIAESFQAELRVLHSPAVQAVPAAIASFRPQLILIFGGDGTLHRHLDSLVAASTPVLVVPVGSGNDFARANGILTAEHAARLFEVFLRGQATIVRSDLGTICASDESGARLAPQYFSCCANIGLDSDAAQRTNSLPNWLKANSGYFIAALAALIRYQPQVITVHAKDANATSISELAWLVSISNTPTYGGGLKIAPQASITDGLLDITFLPRNRFSRLQLLRHLPKIFNGSHLKLSGLKFFATPSLSGETEVPLPIYADAEYVGLTPCEITTAPKALAVLRF